MVRGTETRRATSSAALARRSRSHVGRCLNRQTWRQSASSELRAKLNPPVTSAESALVRADPKPAPKEPGIGVGECHAVSGRTRQRPVAVWIGENGSFHVVLKVVMYFAVGVARLGVPRAYDVSHRPVLNGFWAGPHRPPGSL